MVRVLLRDLFVLTMLLIAMVLAAAMVAGLAAAVGRAGQWEWFHWLIAAPLLYSWWLIGFLLLSALNCRLLGRRFPKPRYVAFGSGGRAGSKSSLGLATAMICNQRFWLVRALPLVAALGQAQTFKRLVLHAYSPSVQIGRRVRNYGDVYDPDLTDIGDDAIIGGGSAIVAHSLSARHDGEVVYVSAPITIGRGATIGGEARVGLGCVIGEGAIVEPGAVVEPFTRIPAGEVWGGNPARFRRERGGDPAEPRRGDADASTSLAEAAPAADEVRQFVLEALELRPDGAPAEPSSETCSAWDSLGQVAIAAAIFDRYGVTVDAGDVFRLRTLQDVADAVAGRGPAPAATGADRPHSMAAGPTASASGNGAAAMALPDDLELLPLLDPRQATRALSTRFLGAPAGGRPLRVVIAAGFTAQPLATTLKLWGRAFGLELDCRFAGHDRVVQTLLDRSGPFAANGDGVNVVLVRPEDLAADAGGAAANLELWLDALERFAASRPGGGQLLVGTLPPVVSAFAPPDRALVEPLRQRWRARLESMPGVEPFDFAELVERLGVERARSSQAEALARAPYSARLYQELGIGLVRRIRAARRSAAKVIALDCDNTLWGGVVGEVGLDGIQLGPDGEGRSYQLFQRSLKQLQERGVLLVVVSRNEEPDVREVFASHPGMVLRAADIAAWRVNWRHKSENLRELADELNLGLDAFVLLDDDPAARLEVQTRLPEVHVVPLPADPAAYCEALARLWLFDGIPATSVDAARTRLLQEERLRQQGRRSVASLEEFLAGLELRVETGPPADGEWPRVAQLTQRTNQFNLSLKRRTAEEAEALGSDGSVLVLQAADRFGDYGLVGAAILRPVTRSDAWEIDTLLMSCRALGRGLEDAFLHEIAATAARRGAGLLLAPYVEGPRNGQVREFLARSGFVEGEPNLWTRRLAEFPALPAHVRLSRRQDSAGTPASEAPAAAPA